MAKNKKSREIAKEVFQIEANEILESINKIDKNFDKAIKKILCTKGKVIIVGVGKSGLIGAKIAATFASTGTSSFFIHPTEALHGDLGMIGQKDLIIAISYSGESEEILNMLISLKQRDIPIISLTSNKKSAIGQKSDIHLSIKVNKEACPLNIAPTSSTTLTLVLGDALAVVLMKARNFKKEDFALFHPGGKLGKRLFLKAKDFIQTQNLPIVKQDTILKKAIIEMTSKMLGTLLIVNEKNRLIGILSDGDFRRAIMREDFSMQDRVDKYITLNPKISTNTNMLAIEALKTIEKHNIQVMIFANKKKEITGLIHMHSLVKAGI